jgi:hypothetical protein
MNSYTYITSIMSYILNGVCMHASVLVYKGISSYVASDHRTPCGPIHASCQLHVPSRAGNPHDQGRYCQKTVVQ